MQTKKETRINGDIYKSRRSISTQIGNEINDDNNNLKKIKSRHRKTASSYFLGSYVSGNELNKFLKEYKGLNNDNTNNNAKKDNNNKEINNINELKDIFLEKNEDNNSNKNNNNINNDNFIHLSNASFYSYSMDDNNDNQNKEKEEQDQEGSVIIKGEEESLNCNNETKSNSYNANYSDFFSNNPFYELEKNNEKYGKDKSFIPIKNGLKFIKDKEERVTESYLLALKGDESTQKKGKNPYLSTASIIEEERSEFIESTSKKQSIVTGNILIRDKNIKKKKIENEFNLVKDNKDNILEKSEDEENKENTDININNNSNKIIKNEICKDNTFNKKNSKLEFDININKINKAKKNKIEIKRKCLRKNKENLLNSFYNLSCSRSVINTNVYKTQKKENENGKSINSNNITNNNTQKYNNRVIKKNSNIDNSKVSNKIHDEFFKYQKKLSKNDDKNINININNNPKKKRTYSYNGGYISYLYNQRFETENNNIKTNKTNISKYLFQNKNKNIICNNTSKNNTSKNKSSLNKTVNNQPFSKIMLTKISKLKIPHKKFDKNKIKVINEKMNSNSSKIKKLGNRIILDLSNQIKSLSLSKGKNDKFSIHRKIFSSIGLENRTWLNINTNIPLKCKKHFFQNNFNINKDNTNFEKNNKSQIVNKRKKQIINSKERLPTYSDSRSRVEKKIKYKIINNKDDKKIIYMKKANSGVLKVKLDSELGNKSEFDINISNKNQTIIILKEKIKYNNIFQKNEVIEKMKKILNQKNSNFIILCKKVREKNNEEFIFCGLFKYNENSRRFIKISGNKETQNFILLKEINNSNYIIYENKIIQNEEKKIDFLFEELNYFYFSFNSIIIILKNDINIIK